MGLLDFLRRRGRATPGDDRPAEVENRDEASVGPPGFPAEGPPVGASDPGSLSEGGPPGDEGAPRR